MPVWFLLVLYTAGLLRSYSPYLDYAVNFTYITKVLCENKDKAGSCCQGSCHLKKQLKKAAEETSKPGSFQIANIMEEFYLGIDFDWKLAFYPDAYSKSDWFYLLFIPATNLDRESPPPQQLV